MTTITMSKDEFVDVKHKMIHSLVSAESELSDDFNGTLKTTREKIKFVYDETAEKLHLSVVSYVGGFNKSDENIKKVFFSIIDRKEAVKAEPEVKEEKVEAKGYQSNLPNLKGANEFSEHHEPAQEMAGEKAEETPDDVPEDETKKDEGESVPHDKLVKKVRK